MSQAPVGFFSHPAFLQHDTGPGHPERPERLRAILAHLAQTDLWPQLRVIEPEPVSRAILELVHPPSYVRAIEQACRQGPTALDADTIASPGSWEAALRACGSVVQAIDGVMEHRLRGAFCAVRPPGHHALAERAMGFCLFNNIAVGARYALTRRACDRVLIVDWDVHHGNGTQAIFYDEPRALYFSTHQFPWYPGTGAAEETGAGKGRGRTCNVPLPAGSGDAELIQAFEQRLMPIALDFKPQLVLISAGFDAHRDDPLAGLAVTEAGFTRATELICEIATRCCPGRIVSALEGGYDLPALSRSVEAHLRVLLHQGAP